MCSFARKFCCGAESTPDLANGRLSPYSAAMADPPDPQDLAKRYLDLWHDQLRAMAADPETMATVGRMLASVSGKAASPGQDGGNQPAGELPNPFAWWPMTGAMPTFSPFGGATPFDPVFAAGRPGAEAGSSPAAAPSDGGVDQLRELERRLAALEGRLDALESGAGKRRGSAKAKPGKGKR